MKKTGVLVMLLMVSASLFPQSKAVLNARIETLSAKIETLSAEIQLVKEQNKSLIGELATLKTLISDLDGKLISLKGQEIPPTAAPQVNESQTATVNDQAGKTKRCKAITQAGTQCTRNAELGSDYCWQHKSSSTVSKSTGAINNSTSTSNTSSKTIMTGPRGGQYYINKNGNKTYIKRK